MVGVVEVDLGVEATLTRGIKEVVNEQERVAIFSCDFIKIAEINAQVQGAVLFTDEKDGHTVT